MIFIPVIFMLTGAIALIKLIYDLIKRNKVGIDVTVLICSIILVFATMIYIGNKLNEEAESSSSSHISSIAKKSSVIKKANSSISSSSSSVSAMSPTAVKKALKPLADDSNLVDSVKVNGFNTDGAGGAVIIKTTDFDNVVAASDIDKIIVKTCQLLAKKPQITGTGLNIKVVSPDAANGNNVETGYAHVDSNQLANVNDDNIATAVQDYQNKGN